MALPVLLLGVELGEPDVAPLAPGVDVPPLVVVLSLVPPVLPPMVPPLPALLDPDPELGVPDVLPAPGLLPVVPVVPVAPPIDPDVSDVPDEPDVPVAPVPVVAPVPLVPPIDDEPEAPVPVPVPPYDDEPVPELVGVGVLSARSHAVSATAASAISGAASRVRPRGKGWRRMVVKSMVFSCSGDAAHWGRGNPMLEIAPCAPGRTPSTAQFLTIDTTIAFTAPSRHSPARRPALRSPAIPPVDAPLNTQPLPGPSSFQGSHAIPA